MKLLGLHSEWAIFRDMWRNLIWGKRLTLAQSGKREVFKINDDDDDDEIATTLKITQSDWLNFMCLSDVQCCHKL